MQTMPSCPIRGHAHALQEQRTWSEDCGEWKTYLACLPKDCYRWTRAGERLLGMMQTAPPAILRAAFWRKRMEWEGEVWIRHTRPHWGWPTHWEP